MSEHDFKAVKTVVDDYFNRVVGDGDFKADVLAALGETETLRDRFAMAALPGLMAMTTVKHLAMDATQGVDTFSEWGKAAYGLADAMMKAREAKS